MKKHVISVSSHDLTRCSHCSRHQQIDRGLSSEELLALKCHFCHAPLIASNQASTSRLGRTSKLAIGLLSASLSFTAVRILPKKNRYKQVKWLVSTSLKLET